MIVIGVDVHKHSLTAVAVDELGRTLAERTGQVEQELVEWARSLSDSRLWALEDCRHVTRALERTLQDHGERLVRVPPRLTAPQRRRGRTRGKSDRIDGLAIASAQTPSSPAMPASHRSTPAPANTNATASTGAATDNSTARSIGSP
jgi:transposase